MRPQRLLLFAVAALAFFLVNVDSASAQGNLPPKKPKPPVNLPPPANKPPPSPPPPADSAPEDEGESSLSCETSATLQAMDLECVSCALQKSTGRRPSEKWLTLIALTSQQYYEGLNYGSTRVQSKGLEEDYKKDFYRHIAEKIQAYGFCLNNKATPDGVESDRVGYGGLKGFPPELRQDLTSLVRGRAIVDNSGQLTGFAKEFGFGGAEAMRAFLKIDGWKYMTASERESFFYNRGDRVVFSGKKGQELEDCLAQIRRFKGSGRFGAQRAGTNQNRRMCGAIARECGIMDGFCSRPEAPPMGHDGGPGGRRGGSGGQGGGGYPGQQ